MHSSGKAYDLIVVGGGLGGYPAAIEAARRGLRVALIEAFRLGGECANYGCIPTKAMLEAARLVSEAELVPGISVKLESFERLRQWREDIVERVVSGIEYLLSRYGVEVYYGQGRLASSGGEVIVKAGDGRIRLECKSALIATGSLPSYPSALAPDHERILDTRDFMRLESIPSSTVLIGAGAIGVELSTMLAALGSKVVVVEGLSSVLPGMDPDVSRFMLRALERMGIKVYTGTAAKAIEREGEGIRVQLESGASIKADVAIIATGRRPNTSDVGLEQAGVETSSEGFIKVDGRMRTSNPRVYAAGDVTGHPMLAHKALAQSVVAARNICGEESTFSSRAVPSVVFSIPEAAGVGVTEREAASTGMRFEKAVLRYSSLGRGIIEGGEGFVKVIFDPVTKDVLGVHAVGPEASSIVTAASLAIQAGLTLDTLSELIAPHPTMLEALREVAELALKRPIHVFYKRG
uniref:Dihydrolipoyl dehydrogenase n=1 Tax=Fervidicoccus fontis TaxID=683846 RepID=A0A7J3ZKJ8_9CREN